MVIVYMMHSTGSEQRVQEGTLQNYFQRTGPFAILFELFHQNTTTTMSFFPETKQNKNKCVRGTHRIEW